MSALLESRTQYVHHVTILIKGMDNYPNGHRGKHCARTSAASVPTTASSAWNVTYAVWASSNCKAP